MQTCTHMYMHMHNTLMAYTQTYLCMYYYKHAHPYVKTNVTKQTTGSASHVLLHLEMVSVILLDTSQTEYN